MGQATVRGGIDTYVGSNYASREHHGAVSLWLRSGENYSLVYLKVPAPRGATVTSATLTVYARGASTGSRTLTAARVASSWKASRTNWDNKPGVLSGGVTTAVTALDDGEAITFDVTSHVQSIVNGAANYGWRLASTASNAHTIYSFETSSRYKPTLTVTWSDRPDAPSSLRPSDSVTSRSHPTLTFDYSDVSGSTELAAVQVQIDPAANGAAPAFDSGEVAAVEPELDLASTAYAGLVDGASTQWRVRVKDAGGLWSLWSDWVGMTRQIKPGVTILNPAAGAAPFVSETTPPILWTTPDQTAWQVRILDAADPATILYDSGKRGGADDAHTIPKGVLADERSYTVVVRGWDDIDREATPGDPVYATASRVFTVDDDPTTDAVGTLTAGADGRTPWVLLEWTRSTAPDSFTVTRDGKVIESSLTPDEVLVSGTTYRWRDHGAEPQRQHTYAVKAVVNGRQSPAGPTAVFTPTPTGIWLVDLERGLYACLAGDDAGSWEMVDEAATYAPIGSTESIRVVSGIRGLEGELSGLLIDGMGGRTFAQHEAALWNLKEHPTAELRLVVADVNIPVVIGDLVIAPSTATRDGDVVKTVSFAFWQTGGLKFTPAV